MTPESFRWLAGLIAAHKDGKVVGRTRLQKTVRLLQRKGAPRHYSYNLHFYGPYSEDLFADIQLTCQMELIREEAITKGDNTYFIYRATASAALTEVQPFQKWIDVIQKTKDIPLELAATYDAFREMGYDHEDAMERLRKKKPAKCNPKSEREALALLKELELSAS
jgi:uncharacterized protein YwgA